jgi:SIR2-like domain
VILAGAGLSAPPPSRLPTWWELNEEVLRECREVALRSVRVDAAAAAEAESLSVSDLPIVAFSQLLHDTFAGPGWFDLLTLLEGAEPNRAHLALAQLAADGVVNTIVTTNFDTLVEQAFALLGVPLIVLSNRFLSDAESNDSGDCWLIKVHGNVDSAASLVDLASQKVRGFDRVLRDLLAERYFGQHVLAVGYSGADLAFGRDYLALERQADAIKTLTWLRRPGTKLHPALEKTLRPRFHSRLKIVDSQLPEFFDLLGSRHPRAQRRRLTSAMDRNSRRLYTIGWLIPAEAV